MKCSGSGNLVQAIVRPDACCFLELFQRIRGCELEKLNTAGNIDTAYLKTYIFAEVDPKRASTAETAVKCIASSATLISNENTIHMKRNTFRTGLRYIRMECFYGAEGKRYGSKVFCTKRKFPSREAHW